MNSSTCKKGNSSVIWWVAWILLTIGSFFVSAHFWTWVIAEKVGSMYQPGVPILWVTAVFGSWMILLVPLIVVMYNNVDKAYDDARIRREKLALKQAEHPLLFKSIFVAESQRLLREDLTKKLKKLPPVMRGGHLVTAILQDGRKIENVFIASRSQVLGIYGYDHLPFDANQIVDLEPANMDRLPHFKIEQWLRLDGVGMRA
jgi:hypothetical protein